MRILKEPTATPREEVTVELDKVQVFHGQAAVSNPEFQRCAKISYGNHQNTGDSKPRQLRIPRDARKDLRGREWRKAL